MQFDAVLRTFADFFEREGIRYAVIGGLAMQAWGASRFTKDVDVVVARSDAQRVVAFAESQGYETLYAGPSHSNHLHPEKAFGRLDVMYVSHETADKIFSATAEKPIVGQFKGPVASPEHLAMMKGVAMKYAPERSRYEGEDVSLLLNLPGVDRDAVKEFYAREGLLGYFDAFKKAKPH